MDWVLLLKSLGNAGLSVQSVGPWVASSTGSKYTTGDSVAVCVTWRTAPTTSEDTQAAAIIAAQSALGSVQQQAIAALSQQANAAVAAVYAPTTLSLLNAIYAQALFSGLVNRAAYLAPVVAWGNGIAAATEAAVEAVLAATTPADVDAVTLSLPAPPWGSGPAPSRTGAMAIVN